MRTETGLGVLHLFCRPGPAVDREAAGAAIKAFEAADGQVVTAAMLGHKCDVAVMALHRDWTALRRLQTGVQTAGLDVVDSYVSVTEVSEYAKGMPEQLLRERLYPTLPPPGKPVFCFYPMTKRREAHANWYATPYERRNEMMREHGTTGRTFAGKVVQLITGSTGLDDFEWGVTLFAVTPEVVKDVVYTMRFDRGSALYGEFGRFFVGYVAPLDEALDAIAR
jgi:hydrogen peroxide-dependent heme synthase